MCSLRTRFLRSGLGLSLCLGLSLSLALAALSGCREDIEVRLQPSGLSRDDVMLEVNQLGRPDPALLARRAAAGDVDGASLLDESACGGPCRALEITLFLTNRAAEPAAPPVVRFSSPAGRPARQPVALTAKEISPGRTGRVRVLLSLWPEESVVEVRPSASVFIDVTTDALTLPSPRAPSDDDATRKD
jgi:hypothetical protein